MILFKNRNKLKIIKKLNTTRKFWAHFGLKNDENGFPDPAEVEKPICHHCYKAASAKWSNMSNLFSHIKDNHRKIYAELLPGASKKQANQATLSEAFERCKKHDSDSKQAKGLSHAVAYLRICSPVIQ